MEMAKVFDFIIIGSGFGGAVSAMRLGAKGYKVLVLETGQRWALQDLPQTNRDVRRYLWAPLLRCFGIQRISLLKGLTVLHGVGVGGGSLVYANTLIRPEAKAFSGGNWPTGIAWEHELHSHYDTAQRMLGVVQNPHLEAADLALKALGVELGVGASFQTVPVGVYFGRPGELTPDPYFAGKGPERRACTLCGSCMVGCRVGAKNTLPMNYLYFAEQSGVRIVPTTTATRIVPLDGMYRVDTRAAMSLLPRRSPSFYGKKVIVAAGVLGTLRLLLRNRDSFGTLPNLSACLGTAVRTNGESLVGATSLDSEKNFSHGLAIGATIQADSDTNIQAVRYSEGSDLMRALAVPMTGPGNAITRPLKMLGNVLRNVRRLSRLWRVSDWARSSVILLVMQTVDGKMRLALGRSLLTGFRRGLVVAPGSERLPSYLPIANRAVGILAKIIKGIPQNIAPEVLLRSTATAHVLGGAVLGNSAADGVVNARHEAFGYPGLYVMDGSVIGANLGVNPSLTITALAERFAAQFPSKDQG